MFFENAWEGELSSCIDERILKEKVFISSNETHEDLMNDVRDVDLPELYGGVCECDATCIYSEKGQW